MIVVDVESVVCEIERYSTCQMPCFRVCENRLPQDKSCRFDCWKIVLFVTKVRMLLNYWIIIVHFGLDPGVLNYHVLLTIP